MDCWIMVGIATFTICFRSTPSKSGYAPVPKDFIFRTRKPNERKAEIPWAINVAQATPGTPICSFATKYKSRAMFSKEENIKKSKGFLESPRALKMAEKALYRNRNRNPKK